MSEKNANEKVKSRQVVVTALRCTSTAPVGELLCESCSYGIFGEVMPGVEEYFCDCDRLISDGADIIENDAREIAALRLALDRLRERVADE